VGEQTEATGTTDTQMQTNPITKTQLLDILKEAQAQFRAFADGLTGDERAAIGEATRWSAKDNLAHMAYWIDHLNEVFAALRNGSELPAENENFQPINERVFAEWRERPWDEVVARGQQAYAQLAANVEACSEEELTNAARTPQILDGPLFRRVIGAAVSHPYEHYGQFYLEHGKPELALAMEERNLSTTRDIFGPSSEVFGDMLYNAGCFYAKNGQANAAIDAMRQAFPLHPWLIEWSKQDSDLDSLRDLPAFQALYQ